MSHRGAMQLALEALQYPLETSSEAFDADKAELMNLRAITALRAALAEPERKAKPITADEMSAWVKDTWEKCQAEAWQEPVAWMQEMPVSGNEERSVRMTTVKMVADEWDNPIPLYLAPTPQPEQPVAWVEPKWLDPDTRGWPSDSFESMPIEGWLPLYTAPTPRKPLTDEELEPLLGALPCYDIGNSDLINFARAIERAHGITGETK